MTYQDALAIVAPVAAERRWKAARLARDIGPIYATAPTYADLVIRVMDQSNVRDAIARARRN